jgi:hypothetical protein
VKLGPPPGSVLRLGAAVVPAASAPKPGDWCVVLSESDAGLAIQIAETLTRRGRYTMWTHAAMCTRLTTVQAARPGMVPTVKVWVAYAQPGGAVEVPWPYSGVPHMWSTGLPGLDGGVVAAAFARKYAGQPPAGYDPARRGVPYNWADYADIAAWRAGLHLPWIRDAMASVKTMICSQFVDQSCLDGGRHLFTDGRAAGDVTPADLADLITERT